jgi:hypothetical protein
VSLVPPAGVDRPPRDLAWVPGLDPVLQLEEAKVCARGPRGRVKRHVPVGRAPGLRHQVLRRVSVAAGGSFRFGGYKKMEHFEVI